MNALRRLWVWMLEPTLVRRSTWSVLLAFFVVWAVLLAYNFAVNQRAIAVAPYVQKFGRSLAGALAEIEDAAQARAALATTERWVNERRADDDRFTGRYRFALLDGRGLTVYASSGFIASSVQPDDVVTHADLEGQPHRIYQTGAGRWTLRIAEPRRMPAAFLAHNARALLPYLLLASPIVLLAVWLSVRNGLRPLQVLADRIRGRTAGDLQPVGFEARHRELLPLVQSLDDLLASARHKLARERAFVQDAAHELRTPLAVVAAQAHVLARSQDAQERALAAPQLEQAVLRAAHLAQQLLELARLDEAQRPPAEPADLAALLRETLAGAFPAARARRIELALEAPEQLHRPADPMVVRSIATNLVDNAVRYSGAGSQVRATLAGRASGGWSLAVQDDGVGIAPAEHERVFERFYRSAGQAETGAGLGLAIVRQAALRLGGSVRVAEGLHGRGVGLLVEVPAVPAARS